MAKSETRASLTDLDRFRVMINRKNTGFKVAKLVSKMTKTGKKKPAPKKGGKKGGK